MHRGHPRETGYMGQEGDSKRYPLHYHAYANDYEGLAAALRTIREEGGGDAAVRQACNSGDQTLRTPLMHAVTDANAGSPLNRRHGGNDGRAEAIVKCVELLLSEGAQPDGSDTFGFSAAHLAAWAAHGRPEPLLLLGAAAAGTDGADFAAAHAVLTRKNVDGDSPLDSARRGCRRRMIDSLTRAVAEEEDGNHTKLAAELAPHIQVSKRSFSPFIYKMMILPRQARDKHRENSKKRPFSCSVSKH